MYTELVCKQKKRMKILLIFRVFQYIWSIVNEDLCFILILTEKNDIALTLNIVHFSKLEIRASL